MLGFGSAVANEIQEWTGVDLPTGIFDAIGIYGTILDEVSTNLEAFRTNVTTMHLEKLLELASRPEGVTVANMNDDFVSLPGGRHVPFSHSWIFEHSPYFRAKFNLE